MTGVRMFVTYAKMYSLLSIHRLPETTISKSHFSETPEENYDNITFFCFIPKVIKKCRKMFENRLDLPNKNFMTKIILNIVFFYILKLMKGN